MEKEISRLFCPSWLPFAPCPFNPFGSTYIRSYLSSDPALLKLLLLEIARVPPQDC